MNAHHDKKMPNNTGIPDKMKKDFEERSRVPLDNVRVYRNSPLPERYGALAFSKGDSIYIKSGEERYLEHEIVHQIQAAQGMVEAEERINGEAFNQNPVLEDEAERGIVHAKPPVMQKKQETIQRKIGMEFQTYGGNRNVKRLKKQQGLDNQALIEAFNNCVNSNGDIDSMLEPAERDTILDFSGGVGYQVTADGPDLEYITNAFNETDKDGLVYAVSQAAEQHKEYTGMAGALAFAGGKYYCTEGVNGVYCIYKNGEQTAHPQATVGIKYEKIPDLIKKITDARSGHILYQERKESIRGNLTEAKERADKGVVPHRVVEPEKCRAWIALVEEYIIAANSRMIKKAERKNAELEAIEKLKTNVDFHINKARQLQEFHEEIESSSNIIAGRTWIMGVAASGKLFCDEETKGQALGQKLNAAAQKYRELLGINKKIAMNEEKARKTRMLTKRKEAAYENGVASIGEIEQQIEEALQAGKKETASKLRMKKKELTMRQNRWNGELQKLRREEVQSGEALKILAESAAVLTEELRLGWDDFQEYGNGFIAEIKAAAEEKANDWPEYQEEEGRDSYLCLTLYYHKLKDYIDDWPQIKKNESLQRLVEQIDSYKPVNPERYFKTLLPVKSRTSFYDLYMLLDPNDQAYVINYLTSKYPHDALIEEDTTNCTTLRDWLDAMEERVRYVSGRRDIVNYELENGVRVRKGDYDYMQAFGVERSTDIGHDSDTKRVEGALLELRRLKDRLSPDDWAPAAGAIADIVAEVNGEKPKRHPARTERVPGILPELVTPVMQRTVPQSLGQRTQTGPATSLRRTVLPPLHSGQ